MTTVGMILTFFYYLLFSVCQCTLSTLTIKINFRPSVRFSVLNLSKWTSCLISVLIKPLETELAECSRRRQAPPTSHSLFHLLKTPISQHTTLRGNSSAGGTVLKSTSQGRDDSWGEGLRRKYSELQRTQPALVPKPGTVWLSNLACLNGSLFNIKPRHCKQVYNEDHMTRQIPLKGRRR